MRGGTGRQPHRGGTGRDGRQQRPGRDGRQQLRRRRPLVFVTLVLGVALVVLAALGLGAGSFLIHRYDSLFPRDQLLAPNARAGGHGGVQGPLNFLLLGSDARTTGPDASQRSDTVIVLHVAADLKHAYLLSIPRDLRVDIPSDPELGFAGQTDKINAAFQYGRGGRGGVQLLSQTLTNLTGVHFDGAAVVNFTGLQRAVGVLGSMTICVDVRTVSIHTHAVYEPGCQKMTPAQVLDYLRQRETLPNGDFDRQRHQQQFLRALFDQMHSAGVLTNPVKFDGLMRAVAGSVVVDSGSVSLPDLVVALRNLTPDAVTGIRLPADPTMIDDISYVVLEDDAGGLFDALRNDSLDGWAAGHPQWVNSL